MYKSNRNFLFCFCLSVTSYPNIHLSDIVGQGKNKKDNFKIHNNTNQEDNLHMHSR